MPNSPRRFVRLLLTALAVLGPGCAGAPGPGIRQGAALKGFEADSAVIVDPMAYLREVAARAEALGQYRLTFYRQERLGIVPTLRAMERIAACFRREPFSVHFRWLDNDTEYVQAAFVRGENDDKVLLLPRRGLLGLPPVVARFSVQDAVTFQKSRNPITDFGLARMMQRTLARIDAARSKGGADVRYRGVESVGPNDRPAHRFEMRFPRGDPYPNKRMDLYVDVRSGLPLGVYLWLPNGDLDALYLYEDLQADATLTAADFRIDAPAARGKPASDRKEVAARKSPALAPQQ